jgi:hypothetical protein
MTARRRFPASASLGETFQRGEDDAFGAMAAQEPLIRMRRAAEPLGSAGAA